MDEAGKAKPPPQASAVGRWLMLRCSTLPEATLGDTRGRSTDDPKNLRAHRRDVDAQAGARAAHVRDNGSARRRPALRDRGRSLATRRRHARQDRRYRNGAAPGHAGTRRPRKLPRDRDQQVGGSSRRAARRAGGRGRGGSGRTRRARDRREASGQATARSATRFRSAARRRESWSPNSLRRRNATAPMWTSSAVP